MSSFYLPREEYASILLMAIFMLSEQQVTTIPSSIPCKNTLCVCFVAFSFIAGYSVFALMVYKDIYKEHFIPSAEGKKKRLPRTHADSPSSYKMSPPALRGWRTSKKSILKTFKLYPSKMFATFRDAQDVHNINHDKAVHQKKQRKSSTKKELPNAPTHDMDNIDVTFLQFLWALTFVAPFSVILWRKNVLCLRLRVFLEKMGVLKMKPVDYEVVVGKLMLEQSQVIHYLGTQGQNACFTFPGKFAF